MRRLFSIAVFVLLMACVALLAQRGGGHASAGGHGGFGGGHAGGGHGGFAARGSSGGQMGGGHSFNGQRSGLATRSFGRSPSFNRSRSSRGMNNSRRGLRNRFRAYGNNCYGCGLGYGYPYLDSGLDPYWWWDSGSSSDQDQQDQIGLANEMNQQSLDEQRARRESDQDVYARSAPAPPREKERTEAAPATVLVFRDQHKQEVQNYAIVGQTLWTFAPQHTQKIPLSDLDLPATTKANDERGVDFRLPSAHEGQ